METLQRQVPVQAGHPPLFPRGAPETRMMVLGVENDHMRETYFHGCDPQFPESYFCHLRASDKQLKFSAQFLSFVGTLFSNLTVVSIATGQTTILVIPTIFLFHPCLTCFFVTTLLRGTVA